MVVHPRVLDRPGPDLAAVDAEVDVVAGIGVLDVDDPLPDPDGDVHLLLQLAGQRLLVGLPRLHPPAGKLPEKRQGGRGRALGDEVAAILLDHPAHDPDLAPHDPSTTPAALPAPHCRIAGPWRPSASSARREPSPALASSWRRPAGGFSSTRGCSRE